MTFIITVAQRKGGAGKTTLCCQLTTAFLARGLNVAALDLDDQKSFTGWASVREDRLGELDFAMETASGFSLSSTIRRTRQADIVLIDTPPTADLIVNRAIGVADLVLAPMQLSPFDLEASLPTARMIGQARRNALFVVNRAPPRARIADRIREKIVEFDLPCASVEIGNRAAFTETLANGRSVMETARTSQAAVEIQSLADELLNAADIARRAA